MRASWLAMPTPARALGPATLAPSPPILEEVMVAPSRPELEPATLATSSAGVSSPPYEAVKVGAMSGPAGRDSVDSKLTLGFFLVMADTSAAVIDFFLTLILGAIMKKQHEKNRFLSHKC